MDQRRRFLLGESPTPAHRAVVREKYADFALRSAAVITLAQKPEEIDRAKFDEGLESPQPEVVAACVAALEKLPPADTAVERFALVAALRRPVEVKPGYLLRDRIARLLVRTVKEDFGFIYGSAGRQPQPEVLKRADLWLKKSYPEQYARLAGAAADDSVQVGKLLANVNWGEGDVHRGQLLFQSRKCSQCHGGSSALGPELSGVARRFSRGDLFTAIVQPSRDVSPRYRATMIETAAGQVYTGMIVYEAVDGVILHTAADQTFRIKPADIEDRRTLRTSLMPTGLLKGLTSGDLADLYAYLQSLSGEPLVKGPSSRALKVEDMPALRRFKAVVEEVAGLPPHRRMRADGDSSHSL